MGKSGCRGMSEKIGGSTYQGNLDSKFILELGVVNGVSRKMIENEALGV